MHHMQREQDIIESYHNIYLLTTTGMIVAHLIFSFLSCVMDHEYLTVT
jgi:hypothetical protein